MHVNLIETSPNSSPKPVWRSGRNTATLKSAERSTRSSPSRISPAAKIFDGQRRTLPQAEINRGAQNLIQTLYDLRQKKMYDMLYTKANNIYIKGGCIIRLVSFICLENTNQSCLYNRNRKGHRFISPMNQIG